MDRNYQSLYSFLLQGLTGFGVFPEPLVAAGALVLLVFPPNRRAEAEETEDDFLVFLRHQAAVGVDDEPPVLLPKEDATPRVIGVVFDQTRYFRNVFWIDFFFEDFEVSLFDIPETIYGFDCGAINRFGHVLVSRKAIEDTDFSSFRECFSLFCFDYSSDVEDGRDHDLEKHNR